ncbi:MAG: restriction endonuclease subunit S [Pleomorphochaeta sp.]
MEKKDKIPQIRFAGFNEPWEQRKFSDIFNYERPDNYIVKSVEYNDNFETPVLTANKGFILGYTNEKNIYKNKSIIFDDFTLDSKYIDFPYMVKSSAIKILTIKNSKKDNLKCAYYLLSSANVESLGHARHYISIVQSTNVFTPTIAEQNKIASSIGTVDNLITLHQRKLEKLKTLKKSLLEKMFPKSGYTVPEIRFKNFTDPWEQRKLSEIVSMHARIGWQNLRTSEFLDSGKYMLITGTDFEDGVINYKTCHYVEQKRYDQDKKIQIKNGNILITKDGTLGKVAYVKELTLPATLNAGVFNLELKNINFYDSKYLFQYLKAPFLMNYVEKNATGGTIKHLNQNILINFPVKLSDRKEQEQVGLVFERIDNLITLHQRQFDKLNNIKKSLLEKMFV